jgi:hypothetical protein
LQSLDVQIEVKGAQAATRGNVDVMAIESEQVVTLELPPSSSLLHG